jgi:hypothetical protein
MTNFENRLLSTPVASLHPFAGDVVLTVAGGLHIVLIAVADSLLIGCVCVECQLASSAILELLRHCNCEGVLHLWYKRTAALKPTP